MSTPADIKKLFVLRNQYGKEVAAQKSGLLNRIDLRKIKSKNAAELLYSSLLFVLAYPDNKKIHREATALLREFEQALSNKQELQYRLYNSGITGTTLCAAFSFEMVKWLRATRPSAIEFNSFEAPDPQIQSILSVLMSKTESEIFQDRNAEWKGWLKNMRLPGETLLDQLIEIFHSSSLRPEIKDELWNTIGINVTINFSSHCALPPSLTTIHYHRSLINHQMPPEPLGPPVEVQLDKEEALQVLDCCRMILVRKLRELDPISYTDIKYLRYFTLQRGMSMAIMGMVPERRHPIDNYMGYVLFKNGLPVSYAGSWIFFDSARISLNVFTDYRGGEAKYIFDQAMQVHQKVYRLKRFTVDPYQLGKDNSDGIQSGAFWIYYRAGFRPMLPEQQDLAAAEQEKISAKKGYRSSNATLQTLAGSRLELVLQKNAVGFDVTDLSRAYAAIISQQYKGNRTLAERTSLQKLSAILKISGSDEKLQFILKSWSVVLISNEHELRQDKALQKTLRHLFRLKAGGSEEAYNALLQQTPALKKMIQKILDNYVTRKEE